MAVIKVFTSHGVKTVQMLGNLDDVDYDPVDDETDIIEDDGELTVGLPIE